MLDTLTHYFTLFSAYAKLNPIIAGAMSLWGLGVLTWLCKGVPVRIWNLVKRQATTSLTFTSSSTGTERETFANFMRWFQKGRWAKWSRSFSITASTGERFSYHHSEEPTTDEVDAGTVIGVGDGTHFFTYRGWPFWLRFSRTPQSAGGREIVYQIDLTGFGRNRQRVLDLIEEFRHKPCPRRIGAYTYRHDWCRQSDVLKRALDTVVIRREIKDELVANLQQWMESRDWYESRGLPYKMTCILRGQPGTGKTSLIKALASHLRMNVCMVNLSAMTDPSFEAALGDAPRNSIIVIEDFDSSTATRTRKAMVQQPEPRPGIPALPQGQSADDDMRDLLNGGLTLSGILNALDGLLSLDGKIIFLTTNVYETIDPALLRKGRVDYTYELLPLTDTEVRDYITLMFPKATTPQGVRFADILGCDLQSLYFEHRDNEQGFIGAIPKESHCEAVAA